MRADLSDVDIRLGMLLLPFFPGRPNPGVAIIGKRMGAGTRLDRFAGRVLIVGAFDLQDHITVPEAGLRHIQRFGSFAARIDMGAVGDVAVGDRDGDADDEVVDDMLLRLAKGPQRIGPGFAIDHNTDDQGILGQPALSGRTVAGRMT